MKHPLQLTPKDKAQARLYEAWQYELNELNQQRAALHRILKVTSERMANVQSRIRMYEKRNKGVGA